MPLSTEELEARVKLLRDSYAIKLPAKLEQIGANITALAKAWDEDCALETGRLAHNLAGTGQTFGFADIGAAAHELETHLLAIQSEDRPHRAVAEMRALLGHLFTAAHESGVHVDSGHA